MELKRQNPKEAKRVTNSKPIPHIPLPFKEVIANVLKVKPPEKPKAKPGSRKRSD
jgi:hypothetical protein